MRYLEPVPARKASGKLAELYSQIDREFLLGEPLTLHSCAPELLAGVWSTFRETFIAGRVKRALKEAVAVAVSRSNRCPFCLDAHSMALRSTSSSAGIGHLREGDTGEIEDDELRDVARWAESASHLTPEPHPAPPVPPGEVPELVGALVWMHFTNRMVNLFVGESLIPVSSNRFGIRSLIERIASRFLRWRFNFAAQPGESLPFLEDSHAEIPADLAWTAGSPVITRAFAGLIEVVERGARESVPEAARQWFQGYLIPDGDSTVGMSRRWLDEPLEVLDQDLHPVGRLLLLAARAPYQVTDSDIEEFRQAQPEERALLQATAWAALTVARRIAARVQVTG